MKVQRSAPHTIRRRKANWIGHALRRNCLLTHVIKGKIGLTGGRGRRRKQLLGGLKEKRGYCRLKEETLDSNLQRTGFGRDCGTAVRQNVTSDSRCHVHFFDNNSQQLNHAPHCELCLVCKSFHRLRFIGIRRTISEIPPRKKGLETPSYTVSGDVTVCIRT